MKYDTVEKTVKNNYDLVDYKAKANITKPIKRNTKKIVRV